MVSRGKEISTTSHKCHITAPTAHRACTSGPAGRVPPVSGLSAPRRRWARGAAAPRRAAAPWAALPAAARGSAPRSVLRLSRATVPPAADCLRSSRARASSGRSRARRLPVEPSGARSREPLHQLRHRVRGRAPPAEARSRRRVRLRQPLIQPKSSLSLLTGSGTARHRTPFVCPARRF